MKKIIIFIILLLPLTITAAPTKYTRAVWNPVANADGYRFYCSPTKDFSNPLELPGANIKEVILSDLPCVAKDGDYFIAVTAYNQYGESGAEAWLPVKSQAGSLVPVGFPDAPGNFRLE